jgi:CBS-domain-containing membrane protein
MRVEVLMSKQVATCKPQDSLHTAARLMWECDCGCVPVVDENSKVTGMITDRDICMATYFQDKPLRALSVSSSMSKRIYTCRPEDTVESAEGSMQANQVRRLPVVSASGRIVGIISINDIAREAAREHNPGKREVTEAEVAATVAAVCEPHTNKESQRQLQPAT